jgi:extracellular elastinolytic metalloproteinase
MNTLPDGVPPTMQMYLFHFPGTTAAQEPYVPSSSDFSADVLYHEYTHGLSNRLVVDASGNGALNAIQARSMGEAWSD